MPEEFGGVRTVLDVAGEIERQQQAREQQEVVGVMSMAKIDPKGAEGAWNRGYLGLKYGPVKYAGSKGDWAAYRDGAGKLYSFNRTTGEFKDEPVGEPKPVTGIGDIPAATRVELTKRKLPVTTEGVVKLGELEAEEAVAGNINKELKDLMALNARDSDAFVARLRADKDLKAAVRPEHWFWDWNRNEVKAISRTELYELLRAKHKGLAAKKVGAKPTATFKVGEGPAQRPGRQKVIDALEAAGRPVTEANIAELMRQDRER